MSMALATAPSGRAGGLHIDRILMGRFHWDWVIVIRVPG